MSVIMKRSKNFLKRRKWEIEIISEAEFVVGIIVIFFPFYLRAIIIYAILFQNSVYNRLIFLREIKISSITL